MDLNNMSEETFVRKFGIRFDRSKVSNKKIKTDMSRL